MRTSVAATAIAAVAAAIPAAGCAPSKPARPRSGAKATRPEPERETSSRGERPRRETAPRVKPHADPKPATAAGDAARARWKVVSVHDGDTLRCLDADDVQHKVRLHGIDAPEIGQAFGTKSREQLAALAMGHMTIVDHRGEDRYGRTLARLEVDGRDVSREMIAAGMAWHYVRYDSDPSLAEAEREARAAKRGLWADPRPVPPWDWRAEEREREQARRKPASP
ncbi:MAG: thermonuclease family protein [Planctomycetaceae bacterium]